MFFLPIYSQTANDPFFELGKKYYEEKNYEKAIENLNLSLKLDSSSIKVLSLNANAKIKINDYKGALIDFDKCVHISPSAKNYNGRGYAKFMLDDNEGAIQDYNKSLELDPYYKFAYANRGDAKKYLKNYSAAIEDYTKAIQLERKASYYFDRGKCYEELKLNKSAIDDFNNAIQLDSAEASYYLHRGFAYSSLKKHKEATKDFEKVTLIDPKNDLGWSNLSSTYRSLKKYEEAIYCASRAIEIDPKYYVAWNNRSSAEYHLKKFKDARRDADSAIAINPSYKKALSIRKTIMLAQSKKAELKNTFTENEKKQLENITNNALIREAQLSYTYSVNDLTIRTPLDASHPFNKKEVDSLLTHLKGNYEDASIYYNLGRIYDNNFDTEKAQNYYKKSLKWALKRVDAFPDSTTSYVKLGVVYFSLHDYEKGTSAYQKALDLDSDFSKYSYNLQIPIDGNNLKSFSKNLNSVKSLTNRIISKNKKSYNLIPFIAFLSCMGDIQSFIYHPSDTNKILLLKGKKTEEIFDIHLINQAMKENPNDTLLQITDAISRQIVTGYKVIMTNILANIKSNNDAFFQDPHFTFEPMDEITLKKVEDYFLLSLQDPAYPYKYAANKSLAFLYLLKREDKKCIPYFKEMIRLKSLEPFSFQNNPSGDYDNLAAVYLLAKDTLDYEKTFEEKIRVKCSINEDPKDDIKIAEILCHHHNYEEAEKYAKAALKINSKTQYANYYLALISIVNHKPTEALQYLKNEEKIEKNEHIKLLKALCFLELRDSKKTIKYAFEYDDDFYFRRNFIDSFFITP